MKQKQNFTLPTISNSTYAGEAASGFIAAALLSAKTLDNQYVTIMPNVKFRSVIQKLDVDSIVKDASCDFVTSGSVSIAERILEPTELQVNLQLCKANFVQSWEAISLGYSAFNEIPRSFTDYLVSYVGGKVAEATETTIWAGVATSQGQFAGFQTLASASIAGSTGVISATSGSTVISGSITSANVLSKLDFIVESIPDTVYGKEDLLIYVPTNVVKAYQQALAGGAQGANGFNNQLNVGEKPLNFNGIELVHCPGLTSSKVFAAQKSNLFFGTGLMSDYNTVKVLDMADIDGSDNFRIIMRYTAGVQLGVLSDVVYYGAF
tara:strand:+ start:1302 stop:2267 length:966 start_codon:yes stop_codon:yes gene_type:complete